MSKARRQERARYEPIYDFKGDKAIGRRECMANASSREGLLAVYRGIEMSNVKPVIDRVFDFEQAKVSCAHLEGGSHFGKVVVQVTK